MSNVDTALALFQSISDDDLDAVAAHFADDAEWVELPLGKIYRGPAGWRENVEYWREGFTDGKAEVTNVVDGGDTVVVEYLGSGLNDRPLPTPQGELPPTGRPHRGGDRRRLGVRGREDRARPQLRRRAHGPDEPAGRARRRRRR